MPLVHNFKQSNPAATGPFAAAKNSESVDISGAIGWSCVVAVTNSTPNASTFATSAVDATADTITKTAHGFATGLKVRFSSTVALPAGLSAGVDYYVIVVDANTYQVADSLAHAQAGTAIDITDVGTGTHTVTPQSIAGCSCKVQVSNDDSFYADFAGGQVTSSQNITATTNLYFSDINCMYKYVRFVFAITSGQITPTLTLIEKSQ